MESALQVDLAKPEAPADQVLNTSLGQIATRTKLEPDSPTRSQDSAQVPKRSLRGASAITSQVRLEPKAPEKLQVGSTQRQDLSSQNIVSCEPNGEVSNVYRLQPVDGGFGAWSYVASAFAMYIVVWGEANLCHEYKV